MILDQYFDLRNLEYSKENNRKLTLTKVAEKYDPRRLEASTQDLLFNEMKTNQKRVPCHGRERALDYLIGT